MEIKFLKAGRGDSILVSSKGEHMLVDGGDDTTYLFRELDQIHAKKEVIKYLVITHHDSDHIKGIIDLFDQLKQGRYGIPKEFIKCVFFNSPRIIKKMKKESDKLSYSQAFEVEKKINELEINFDNLLIDSSDKLFLGDIEIKCLSPTKEILDNYLEETPEKFLSSYSEGDWKKSLKELAPFVMDHSLDTSSANLTSIVLLIQGNNKSGLLTGDVTPKRFEILADKLYKENGNKKVSLDFLKLPHHGSHRSITKEIVSKFNCDTFVISTDGNNSYLPNKKTFLKLIEYQDMIRNELTFMFNYSDLIDKIKFTEEEKSYYKFKIESNNFDHGTCI
jgi:beta-lactamase superfamily II metal-dependent hydrolase